MMTKTFLLSTALVLMTATPVLAADGDVQTRSNIKTRGDTGSYVEYSSDAETVTKKEVKQTLDKAEKSIKKAANKVTGTKNKEAAAKAAPAAATATAAAGLNVTEAKIAQNNSAEHMIGKPVMNAAGERVGSVHDVILSQNGTAKTLIVADGGMMSVGDKKAAFDYSVINGRDAKGALLTSITEEQINKAKTFAYEAPAAKVDAKADAKDAAKADANVQVIAANETSVREVLGAKVVNADQKTVGAVKDVAIENGHAQKLIVAYDQILGLGGKKVGLSYQDVALVDNDGGQLNLRLNAAQAQQLTNAKNVVN